MSDPLAPGQAYEVPLFGDLPVQPYPDGQQQRSSGWSGSETSHERAQHDDASGATTERQQALLRYLAMRGTEGTTWKELATHFEWHHGQASGALSNLHKEGLIDRLADERRSRCAVYVLPQHAGYRRTAAQGRDKRPSLTLDAAADVLAVHEPLWQTAPDDVVCLCGHNVSGGYTTHLMSMLAKETKP